jgi:hypothetical protein
MQGREMTMVQFTSDVCDVNPDTSVVVVESKRVDLSIEKMRPNQHVKFIATDSEAETVLSIDIGSFGQLGNNFSMKRFTGAIAFQLLFVDGERVLELQG